MWRARCLYMAAILPLPDRRSQREAIDPRRHALTKLDDGHLTPVSYTRCNRDTGPSRTVATCKRRVGVTCSRCASAARIVQLSIAPSTVLFQQHVALSKPSVRRLYAYFISKQAHKGAEVARTARALRRVLALLAASDPTVPGGVLAHRPRW